MLMKFCDEFNKLERFVSGLPEKLDTKLGGDSVVLTPGQKQLFSFARALLRQRKILCMDESTSSLDDVTDKEIQSLLQRKDTFDGCTIITIAHRISTILEGSDRILGESESDASAPSRADPLPPFRP